MNAYDEGRIRSLNELPVGQKLYVHRGAGKRYTKPQLAEVVKATHTTVTILVGTREITFKTYESYTGERMLNGEKKTKANEFPEKYTTLFTVAQGEKILARMDAQARLESAVQDVKNAMHHASINPSAENLTAVKNAIGVLEDVRAEATN